MTQDQIRPEQREEIYRNIDKLIAIKNKRQQHLITDSQFVQEIHHKVQILLESFPETPEF